MTIKLKGKAKKEVAMRNVLVDTGAWYTFVKPSIIKKIKPMFIGFDDIELGNKKTVKAKVYVAKIIYKDRTFKLANIATFPDCAIAIGAHTLEGLGVWIDTRGRRLVTTRPKNVMYFHTGGCYKQAKEWK